MFTNGSLAFGCSRELAKTLTCGWFSPTVSLGLTASGVSGWVTWPPVSLLQGLSSKHPACLPATYPPGPGATQTPVDLVLALDSLGSCCYISVFPVSTFNDSGVKAVHHRGPTLTPTAFLSKHFHIYYAISCFSIFGRSTLSHTGPTAIGSRSSCYCSGLRDP